MGRLKVDMDPLYEEREAQRRSSQPAFGCEKCGEMFVEMNDAVAHENACDGLGFRLTTSPPAPPAAPSRGGMDGNVYGDPENVWDIMRAGEPWDIMCVVFIKDLEKNKHLYRVEVKCRAGTKIAALQERVEWTLDFLGTCEVAFSQSKANITAIVPRRAEDWIDVARPDQTVGELENEFGMSVDELSTKDDNWKYRGEQKKGLRFYATTGEPTGEAGFAFWELDGHDGPNRPLLVHISNSLKVFRDGHAVSIAEPEPHSSDSDSLEQALEQDVNKVRSEWV